MSWTDGSFVIVLHVILNEHWTLHVWIEWLPDLCPPSLLNSFWETIKSQTFSIFRSLNWKHFNVEILKRLASNWPVNNHVLFLIQFWVADILTDERWTPKTLDNDQAGTKKSLLKSLPWWSIYVDNNDCPRRHIWQGKANWQFAKQFIDHSSWWPYTIYMAWYY